MKPRPMHAPALDDSFAHPFKGLTLCNFAVRFGGFAQRVEYVTCKLCLKVLKSKRYAKYLAERPKRIAMLPAERREMYERVEPWVLVGKP